MNPRNVTIVVDAEKCTGCGICIEVCPSDTLSIIDGIAVITGENSLSCGHCMAVCPTKAIEVKALDAYYKEYYSSVKKAMDEMEHQNIDRLFHGATACIPIGSGPEASCPREDAMLASGNILLAAHTMGLGSCLIGFAVEAMKADKTIQEKIDVPKKERIYAVIALGYPDEAYRRITGRKKPIIRFK